MAISVTHGGDPIPKGHGDVEGALGDRVPSVAPALDLSKIKVEGLDTSELFVFIFN